jgi:TatD DNase family protein
MIDSHCHLEQHDYDGDRSEVIARAREKLKAVVTSCAHPKDFDLTLKMVEDNKNFIFSSIGLHPEFIKDFSQNQIDDYFQLMEENKGKFVSVGEVGLDYAWVKEDEWRQKQKELFTQFIEFAKEHKKPLTVHCRDAYEDTVKILEQQDAKQVHLHLFGANHMVKQVAENGWHVSVGPIVLSSKKHFQISRDMPLELLLLETDAPWNAPQVFTEHKKVRNEPASVDVVARKIAEIKKIDFEQVDKATDDNAVRFFGLNLSL